MISDKHIPNIEDLKNAGISDAEQIYEIQMKAKKAFSKALEYQKDIIWLVNGYSLKPDVVELGFQMYQDLLMKQGDARLGYLLSTVKDELQKNIAGWIGSDRPQDIAFGTNYTSLLFQILSLYWGKPLKILTSDEEFYASARMFHRLREVEGVVINDIPLLPIEDFPTRFYEEACKEKYDLIILSHVHFKSGIVLDDLDELIKKLKPKTDKILIDGSGAFGNVCIDKSLGHVLDDIYYVGGTFKFLSPGEGFSFLSLPKVCNDRPIFTGWLFGDISDESQYYSSPTKYLENADRYASSTLEMSVWVRVNEIIKYFDKENFTVEMKNKYTRAMQDYFLKRLEEKKISFLSQKNLVTNVQGKWRALQTIFDFKDEKIPAKQVSQKMAESKIFFDSKGTRLRICFPIYHTIFDIDFLLEKLEELDKSLKSTA